MIPFDSKHLVGENSYFFTKENKYFFEGKIQKVKCVNGFIIILANEQKPRNIYAFNLDGLLEWQIESSKFDLLPNNNSSLGSAYRDFTLKYDETIEAYSYADFKVVVDLYSGAILDLTISR